MTEPPADPVAAAYVDLTVAIVTVQEHVKALERDTVRQMHTLAALQQQIILLLQSIAQLLEDV